MVDFTVAADGAVTRTEIVANDTLDPFAADALAAAMERLRFGGLLEDVGVTVFRYRFDLDGPPRPVRAGYPDGALGGLSERQRFVCERLLWHAREHAEEVAACLSRRPGSLELDAWVTVDARGCIEEVLVPGEPSLGAALLDALGPRHFLGERAGRRMTVRFLWRSPSSP